MSQLPYYLRDRLNKCERCGKTWVGVPSRICGDCRGQEPVNSLRPRPISPVAHSGSVPLVSVSVMEIENR